MPRDHRISLLLEFVHQAFHGPAWHGPALWGTLRGVSPAEALARPKAGRHNVWEYALHAAYWKYVVRRRLTRDESLEFPRSPANWPAPPVRASAAAWKADRALLKEQHDLLVRAIERFPAAALGKKAWKSRYTNLQTIEGIASHDLYHGGQVQLVRKLTGA